MSHPSHEKELICLNRTLGQLEGIKRMIAEKRYCVDILSQLRAVRNAIKTIEMSVLETHILNCMNNISILDEKTKTTRIHEILHLLKKYE